ncbi:MAG: serine/threonine protein kinase [Deltaproteobacteria bacterium]|nr:serine/threonine protein kinase [Deltaproteobacteria bacterium]MCB9785637.1 serine/threonine protein kinase [Deltaproteobacteria bacterium]
MAGSLIGRLIAGKYEVTEELGSGGFGAVYKAQHVQTGGYFAVKILWPHLAQEEHVVERFELEARNTSRLHHSNTVRVVDYGWEDDGTLFLVMEFIAGRPLTRLIREQAPLPLSRALRIVRQVLRSLGEAHAHDIVHRDIKPDNIMLLDQFGERDFVKVVDFGISKVTGSAGPTASNTTIGSPKYMAPERWLGREADARADLYAVGCVLFELLTGAAPWQIETSDAGLSVAWMTAHLQREPSSLAVAAGVPFADDLELLLQDLLAKDWDQRPASAEQVLARLEGIESAPPPALDWVTGTGPTHPHGRVGRPGALTPAVGAGHSSTTDLGAAASTGLSGIEVTAPRRRLGRWLAAGAGAVALGMVAAFALSRTGEPTPGTEPRTVVGPRAPEGAQAKSTQAPASREAEPPVAEPPPKTGSQTPTTGASDESPTVAPAVPRIRITSTTPEATLEDARGESRGPLPVDLELSELRRDGPFRVRAPGYRSAVVPAPGPKLTASQDLAVDLEALPVLEIETVRGARLSYRVGAGEPRAIPADEADAWQVGEAVLDAIEHGETVTLEASKPGWKDGSEPLTQSDIDQRRLAVRPRRESPVPTTPTPPPPCWVTGTCTR